jgi:hypothetical protein
MLRWFTRHLFPPRPRVQAATAQLERYAVARAVLSQFGAFLVRASDRELFHVNPRYLAEKLSLQERPTLKLMVAALPLLEHYPNTEVTPRHTVGLSESSIMVPSLPNLLIQRAIDYSRRAPFLP